MRDLRDFAGPESPLRASRLVYLVRCAGRELMTYLLDPTEGSGPAADTGSAVHKAVAAWHRNGHRDSDALGAMRSAIVEYPLADLHDAELSFLPYARDKRNREEEVVLVEARVDFTLPPWPSDPTQAPIHIQGTLDQVRRRGGILVCMDLKTGKPEGYDMMLDHEAQLAAYAHGATRMLGEFVGMGAIVRTRGYRTRANMSVVSPPGVFWWYTIPDNGASILDTVRYRVAEVRSGARWLSPGAWCQFCPHGGREKCIPKMKETA